MRSYNEFVHDSLFATTNKDKEKLILKLVDSLSQEDGYHHMTDKQIYQEQAAMCGIDTGD